MEHTENYQLSIWEKDDRILMEDFNSDNARVDAALAALAEQVAGKAEASGLTSLANTVTGLSGAVGQKADDAALTAEADARASAIDAVNAQVAKLGNCEIYYGTYVGNGEKTRTLTFPHKPLLVIAMGPNVILRAVRGSPNALCRTNGDSGGELAPATWSGSSLTWQGSTLSYICNASNITYYTVALMDAGD